MKHTLLLLAFLATGSCVYSQNSTGTITYKETLQLNIELNGEMAAFAAMLPKERNNEKLLYYTPTASLYKSAPKDEKNENTVSNNGAQMMIKMETPEEIIYKDLEAGKTYEQKDFMGRQFLINGDVKKYNWKMTSRQKEIAGYPCIEATTIRDKDTVTAWFTANIPVQSGPGSLGNLPGMILEAHIGNSYHLTAINVLPGQVDKVAMVKPKAGKKVTSEEFDKIVAEKLRRCRQSMAAMATILLSAEKYTNKPTQ